MAPPSRGGNCVITYELKIELGKLIWKYSRCHVVKTIQAWKKVEAEYDSTKK
jgi:hypothetical protein